MAKKKKPAEPIVEQLAIALPPAAMWEALTSPRILGDVVLGHVQMDPRPGRPFVWSWRVWEKAAPGRIRPQDCNWRGRVLDVVPGSTLVLGGAGESTATLTVKGEGAASLVTVVQADVPHGADLEEYREGWTDFLLKLKTRLEPPAMPEAVYRRALIPAAPNDVLRAALSASAMAKLLPGKAKIAARPGGRFEWQWKHSGARAAGKILEFEKGHRLALSWEATAPASEVRLSAVRMPAGSVVSLEHLGLFSGRFRAVGEAPARDRAGYYRLWAHLLERMRAYFHFGKRIRTS
jgi:uncharacterized protein YndB with AHSA1/START domain